MSFLRFVLTIIFVIILITGGTAGYKIIEGWSYTDSLYMTVITISTVGFQEVMPLSQTGKYFTIILIFGSLGIISYLITNIFTFVFGGKIVNAIRERKMIKFIKRLKDHYIICGGGDVGREIALELKRAKEKFVIIDIDPEKSELSGDTSIPFIKGDAIEDEILLEAGIKKAKGFITALPVDESNAFAVLTARQLNPDVFIVSQVEDDRNIKKLKKSGADRIISPKKIAGKRMASICTKPSVINFLDVITNIENLSLRIEEIIVPQKSPLIDKSIREIHLGEITGAMIISIYDENGNLSLTRNSVGNLSSILLKEGFKLIAFGGEKQLELLKDFVISGKVKK